MITADIIKYSSVQLHMYRYTEHLSRWYIFQGAVFNEGNIQQKIQAIHLIKTHSDFTEHPTAAFLYMKAKLWVHDFR